MIRKKNFFFESGLDQTLHILKEKGKNSDHTSINDAKKSVVKKAVEITDVTMNDDGDDVNKVHDKI